ncbi:uncharacterized protein LOC122081684 [Macadamia integrifolia]|uniref:uncharacterized protein LOC122081684 n=1 Tax=Macadamia integrifolia TaxID=60698 RepID=UPI001C4E411A|nr:uncharacterized protein LOC122081684 [Macadamia integrifolia]
MKILSWNCRGLGRAPTIRSLLHLSKQEKPDVVFLIETKCGQQRVEQLKRRLCMDDSFSIDSHRASGGLALFWKQHIDLEILSSNRHFIDSMVKLDNGIAFFLTSVYGDPVRENRQQVWDQLMQLGVERQSDWMCHGDFNSFLSWREKEGGNPTEPRDTVGFQNLVDSCELLDLPTHGPLFTWNNKRRGAANIRIKLDRALANQSWRSSFPDAAVYIRSSTNSDHCPLIIDSEGGRFKGHRPFRFESMWFRHPDCKPTAISAWSSPISNTENPPLFQKMEKCIPVFRKWNKEVFGHVQTKIKKLEEELVLIQSGPITDDNQVKEHDLSATLNEELKREEELWRQKSRNQWLQQGDRNTSFFHLSTIQRRGSNRILRLKTENDAWTQSDDEIYQVINEYYTQIFHSEGVDQDALSFVLNTIQPKVTEEMNVRLCAVPTMEEVALALKAMGPLKAPGPDGLPPAFFQRFWDFTKEDVYSFTCNFFRTGSLPLHCNDTLLCLIPKCTNPETADQYRPISLCAVVVKIVTKIMASRLKDVMEILVSTAQSAFIPGRSISDNIYTAHEVFNYINKKKKGKQMFLALKLDMKKAYDRVEWEFLEKVLLQYGFSSHWVTMVMSCLRTVTYKLLINGAVRGTVIPTRGIRQGDPLSPALFILCSQALSSVISLSQRSGLLRASHFKLPITHHNHLKKAATKFYWGDGSDKNKIHWISWLRLCHSKERGGLGFRDPTLHNKALLVKVAWRFWYEPDTAWAKFMKSIYFPNCEFLNAKLGTNPSWAWRSIVVGREVLRSGLIWRIGTGENIHIWKDNWLPSLPGYKLHHPPLEDCPFTHVSEFIDPQSRCWNRTLIDRDIHHSERPAIYQIQISLFETQDKQVWGPTKQGLFTVKSAYHFLCNMWTEKELERPSSSTSHRWREVPTDVWKAIWNCSTLPKVKNFLWRACANGLARP